MTNLFDQFFNAFQSNTSKTAFIILGKEYTYLQFVKRIESIAEIMRSLKPGKDDLFPVLTNNHIDTYATIFAAWFSGKGYIPLDPDLSVGRMLEILQALGVSYLLTQSEVSPQGLSPEIQLVNTTTSLHSENELTMIPVPEDKLAYVLFTSGSTGKPKGVQITRKNLNAFYQSFLCAGYQIDGNDRFIQALSFSFDASLLPVIIGLSNGGTVVTVEPGANKSMRIIQHLIKYQVSIFFLAPAHIKHVSAWHHEIRLPNLKYSFLGGEAMPLELVKSWKQCLPNGKIINGYGPAEATLFCVNYVVPDDFTSVASKNGIVSIGKPVAGLEAFLLNENSEIVSDHSPGELVVGGDQVMSEYWGDEALNHQAFMYLPQNENRFYRTGDICSQDDEGNFYFEGRLDHQVKVDGYRIELQEIEFHIKQIDSVEDTVVIYPDSGKYEKRLVAVIKSTANSSDSMRKFLSVRLPKYMVPEYFIILPDLPLNKHDKIDRHKILEIINNDI